jgi:hypothetical protein
MNPGVLDRFDQRFVGLGEVNILADKGNSNLM